jgi:hypothetical protein
MSYAPTKQRRIKMLLYSKTLNKNVTLVTFEKEDDLGRPIKIITHDSLQELIHDSKVKYDFSVISADINHSVVTCCMADSSGRIIKEIGESIPETLETTIARNYPTLIATQRAFDRAAIRYLNLPGKIFSNTEIPIIDGDTGDDNEYSQITVSGISSIVQEDEMLNYNTPTDSIVIDDMIDNNDVNTSVNVDTPIDNEPVIEDINVGIDTTDDLPFDVTEETTETSNDYGNYVITMKGKYYEKNKTIAEIYETDANWVKWIAENFVPRTDVAKKDVEAIKIFVSTKNME